MTWLAGLKMIWKECMSKDVIVHKATAIEVYWNATDSFLLQSS